MIKLDRADLRVRRVEATVADLDERRARREADRAEEGLEATLFLLDLPLQPGRFHLPTEGGTLR